MSQLNFVVVFAGFMNADGQLVGDSGGVTTNGLFCLVCTLKLDYEYSATKLLLKNCYSLGRCKFGCSGLTFALTDNPGRRTPARRPSAGPRENICDFEVGNAVP